MSPTMMAMLAFGVLALGTLAIFLVFRDLTAGVVAGAHGRGPLRLRRMPIAKDTPPPQTMVGVFDQWFVRLARESGIGMTPVSALLWLVLFGLLVGGPMFLWNEDPMLAIVGVILGMGAALAMLMLARARYIRTLQEQLPPALEMLARAVHAGESIDQAVQLVGEKSPEPLAREFRQCGRQLTMGLSMTAVMRSLVYRVRMSDMRVFTTTLSVHRVTGGNLAWTLERLANVIRDRIMFRRQMRATTGAGRMSATIVGLVGPLLFLYMFFVQPQYIRGLTDNALGQALLVLAVSLEIVGLIWIARLLRTDNS